MRLLVQVEHINRQKTKQLNQAATLEAQLRKDKELIESVLILSLRERLVLLLSLFDITKLGVESNICANNHMLKILWYLRYRVAGVLLHIIRRLRAHPSL